MKRCMAIVLLLSLVFVMSACGQDEPPAQRETTSEFKSNESETEESATNKPAPFDPPYLVVTTTSWSGWGEGYASEELDYYFKLEVGFEQVFPKDIIGQEMAITITEVREDGISIHSSEPLSVSRGGGINLTDWSNDHEISFGETLVLATPTMDAGVIYECSLYAE